MDTVTGTHKRRSCALAVGTALSLLCTSVPAQGTLAPTQDRIVFVNGQLLDDEGLGAVDQLNCGDPVPDGNYWLDLDNRLWGHVGVDGQNPLPDCSGGKDQAPAEEDDCESKYRYHEDRMCYCYGVC